MATILIIEDHALSRQMLNTWLGYTGHSILKAGSGEEALAIAREKIPDLIISDIAMPGMDGFELVRRLRQEKELRRIPVIFYTAIYRQPQMIHLHELNETCQAIPKASEPSALLAAINEVLGPPPKNMLQAATKEEAVATADAVQTIFRQGAGLRLAILMELSYNLVSERNPVALLEAFCRGARGFIDCQTALLAIEDEKIKSRYFWDQQQRGERAENVDQLVPPSVIIHQVVKERQPFRWPRGEMPDDHQGWKLGVYRSLLVVPVATSNKVYGCVALGNKEHGRFFTEEEAEMILTLSKQVALAYENLLLMQKLQENEERLRLVLSTTGLCTWTWDLDSNRFTCWVDGSNQEPLVLTSEEFFAAIDSSDRVEVYNRLERAIGLGHDFEVEYRTNCNGRPGWILSKGLVNRVNKDTTEVIGINLDITERKRMEEEALASERELLRITLNSLEEGVIATDRNGRVMLLNCAAQKMIGCSEEEAYNQPLGQLLTVCDGKTGERIELSAEINCPDVLLITRHLGKIPITLQNSPIKLPNGKEIGMVTVFQDITEKRQAERELLKTAKLESLGVLAAGIAHDFNNTLAAIISNLQLAMIQHAKQVDISSTLAQTVEITYKASALTKQLLTFAKGGAPVKKNAPLDRLIRETTEFVLRGSNLKVEYLNPSDLWPVAIDVGQISQVVHNLVLNAKQAMQHGGIITISVNNVEVGVNQKQKLKPGKYVQVTIEDQGVGIKPEILGKIFDPFFTTKPSGNGLGLATAFSIIRQHDGVIEAESTVGVGSTFRIYLPASTQTVAQETEEKETTVTGECLRILLMDDEELICRAVAELLTNFGHEIVTTHNGQETIKVFQEAKRSNNPFDVVILDLTIPGGMGGKEVLACLRSLDPQIKAVVCSGYASDPIMADYQEHGFSGVVSKPYRIDELLAVLRQVTVD
ncbi:MAG: response regulator [Firmicutes bacterium]|nr:response regulator [Bacillota bacterium]